jgi:xanthine dehydrogenase molybdopterin-binding subunit B
MLSDKKLEKIVKTLGSDTIEELNAVYPNELPNKIVAAESAIKQAIEELEASSSYQRLKEDLKALSQGLREVKKRQNAIIQYALHRLENE